MIPPMLRDYCWPCWLPLLLMFGFVGCHQTPRQAYVAFIKPLPVPDWKRVAVLNFSGDQPASLVAADVLRETLRSRTGYEILEPEGFEGLDLSLEHARSIAENLDADAFFHGTIVTRGKGRNIDAIATVDLVETSTGRVVASSHRQSQELLADTEKEHVTSAVERAAKDMVYIMNDLGRHYGRTPQEK